MMLDGSSLAIGGAAGVIVGFLLGYGVRALVSHHRRRKARGF